MAETDDTADKTRRNLMIVSVGILAVWFLELPLDGHLIGAVDLKDVDPAKAWFAAGVVLAYFWLRYLFSPTTAKERLVWRQLGSSRRSELLSPLLRRDFESGFMRGNLQVRYELPAPPSHFLNPEMRELGDRTSSFRASTWNGDLPITWEGSGWDPRRSSVSIGSYRTTVLGRIYFGPKVFAKTLPSWSFLEYVLPLTCTFFAACVIAHRIYIHKISHWLWQIVVPKIQDVLQGATTLLS